MQKKHLPLHGTLLVAPPCFRQNPALEHFSRLVCVRGGADNAAASSLGTASQPSRSLQNTGSLLTALSPEIQEEFVIALAQTER